MEKLSKDMLTNLIQKYFIHEEELGHYVPDLTVISLTINFASLCQTFSSENEKLFMDKCYSAYMYGYVHDTQITENKYLKTMFDMIEFFDEKRTFEMMEGITDLLEYYEFNLDELKAAFLTLSVKYANKIKLGSVIYNNLVSISYKNSIKRKGGTFLGTCRNTISEGRRFIEKNKLSLQKNDTKVKEIKEQLNEAIKNCEFDERYINKNISIIDKIFSLVLLSAVCVDFSGHTSYDFIDVCNVVFNEFSSNLESMECSEFDYTCIVLEPPNFEFIHSFMESVSVILKNNYNTNRMIDLTYALIEISAEYADKFKFGKFRFIKYCFNLFNERPALNSYQRVHFEEELSGVVNLYAATSKIKEGLTESKDLLTLQDKKAPKILN